MVFSTGIRWSQANQEMRTLKSPLRWVGGQSRAAATIVARMPHHQVYVEPCCGAASVFWAKPKDSSSGEILNDADKDLINFYTVLHKRGRRLAAEVDALPYSRAAFCRLLKSRPRTTFQRALRFWYINRVGFGGKRRHRSFGVQATRPARVLPRCVLNCLDATIERLRGVVFECLDVKRAIRLYDRKNTFFYVAPPYPGSFQGYAKTFSNEDHVSLAETLRRARGTWLVHYNNSSIVKQLYQGFYRKSLRSWYTIGCNTKSKATSAGHELLISNRILRAKKNTKPNRKR